LLRVQLRVQIMRIKKASARARANTSKSRQRADGSYPIELLLRFNRQTKHIVILKEHKAIITGPKSNWKITKDSDGLIKERFKKTYPNSVMLNRDIDDLERKASNIIDSLDPFSFDRFFKQLFRAGQEDKVFFWIQKRMDRFNEAGEKKNHESVQNAYKFLLRYTKNKDLTWQDFTRDWLDRFVSWGRNQKGYGLDGKISETTIGIYLREIRAAYRSYCREMDVIPDVFLFSGLIKSSRKRNIAISNEAIIKIKNLTFNKKSDKYLWQSQQYFLFMYLCNGMNWIDLCKLQWGNIIDDRIVYIRSKTKKRGREGKTFSIKISDKINDILSNFPRRIDSEYIFPPLQKLIKSDKPEAIAVRNRITNTLRRFNTNLKKIGKMVDVENLTSYVARHSFASTLYKSNATTEQIKQKLGHSDVRTTEIYLSDFDVETMDDLNKILL